MVLTNLNVGSVRPWAFHRIGPTQTDASFKGLNIYAFSILNIDSEAFVELEGFDRIAFTRTKIATVASGAFSRIHNIGLFLMTAVYIPVIPASTFTHFTNVGELHVEHSSLDVILTDAFSPFSNVTRVGLVKTAILTLENRFLTNDNSDYLDILRSSFITW